MILTKGRKGRSEEEWEVHEFPHENKLQAYVMQRLRKCPGIRPMNISDRFSSGISDILLCVNGRFVAVELKVGSNHPTALQEIFIKEIKEAGGIAGVAYNWGQVKRIIESAGYKWG